MPQVLGQVQSSSPINTYFDGTKITAPFWMVKCLNPECKHEGWSVTYKETCSKCGQPAVSTPANVDKKSPA